MITIKYVEKEWHDKDCKMTAHGVASMRSLFMTGVLFGLLLGMIITVLAYNALG